jgi:hypothetical protein
MKIFNSSLMFICFLLTSHCTLKQPSTPSVSASPNKNINMSTTIKAKVVSAQNQPIADAVASITEGPDAFPEIAAISDANGLFELTTGTKTGVYTINIYAGGQNQTFKITTPQTSDVETLVMKK